MLLKILLPALALALASQIAAGALAHFRLARRTRSNPVRLPPNGSDVWQSELKTRT